MLAGAPPASRSGWHVKPRVPAAAAAARAALFGPSSNTKSSSMSSLAIPTFGTQTQHMPSPPSSALQAGGADLQASSVLSATLAALKQAVAGNAQAMATSADAEESAASAAAVAAAAGVAELRRTEQQSNPEFRAAQETEWQQRQAEIGKQSEYAQRLKRQRKAEKEKKARQEVGLLVMDCLEDCHALLLSGMLICLTGYSSIVCVHLMRGEFATGFPTTMYVLYLVQQAMRVLQCPQLSPLLCVPSPILWQL